MSEIKIVAASIVYFLKSQLEADSLNKNSRESVEVGIQCIETAFKLGPEDAARGVDLLHLLHQQRAPASNDSSTEAERLKQKANELMKNKKYREALELYTRAIEMDPTNPSYLCSRATCHYKLGKHDAAITDCKVAIALQPDYSKAHGRLGLALAALERHCEARSAYARASELDPENESYRRNLRVAEECLAQSRDRPPLDLQLLSQNDAITGVAAGLLTDRNTLNYVSGLMRSSNCRPDGTPNLPGADSEAMRTLMELGREVVQQLEISNPEVLEELARVVNDPKPPQ